MKNFGALIVLLSVFGLAHAEVPVCMAHGRLLAVNTAQVLQWQATSANGYRDRAHIVGTLSQMYRDATHHHHIQVRLAPTDTIELVYNEDFGPTPPLHVGSTIEACGDYITSNAPLGGYRPSPDGAIIHWLHRSDQPGHDNGYLIIDGTVTGLN